MASLESFAIRYSIHRLPGGCAAFVRLFLRRVEWHLATDLDAPIRRIGNIAAWWLR